MLGRVVDARMHQFGRKVTAIILRFQSDGVSEYHTRRGGKENRVKRLFERGGDGEHGLAWQGVIYGLYPIAEQRQHYRMSGVTVGKTATLAQIIQPVRILVKPGELGVEGDETGAAVPTVGIECLGERFQCGVLRSRGGASSDQLAQVSQGP